MTHPPIVPDPRPVVYAGRAPGARPAYPEPEIGTYPKGAAMSGEAEPAAGTDETGGPAGGRPAFDTSVAHSARVHDYWLGGQDHFVADRAAGDAVIAAYPGIVMSVRAHRAFLARAVRFLAAGPGSASS
jgi:hypothetical protein